jgi:hypothetical protein
MRRTKDENRRRKQGAYVDFVPDGDPVGVGGLSSAHARMGIVIGSGNAFGEQQDRIVSEERRIANGADRFMRLIAGRGSPT